MKTRFKFLHLVSCMALISSLFVPARAMEIPVSQTEQMIDGRQTITQVFEVSPDTDPTTLIQEEIVQNGYRYTMTSITKNTVLVKDEKEITQEHSVVVNVSDEDAARLEALLSMPAFIDYDEEGYSGKLYPVINTLSGRETGRTTYSGYKTVKQTYTYEYNDDELVPSSYNGYSLSNVSWAEGNYMDDTAIPENYIATATYRKAYSTSTVDGWEFTMSYTGDVGYEHNDTICYTLVYTGEEIIVHEPTFWEKVFGMDDSTDTNSGTQSTTQKPVSESKGHIKWGVIAGIGFIIIAIAAVCGGVFILIVYLKNNKVDVYAEDPLTGEFQKMKSIWFKTKDSSITIDTLAAPSALTFRVSLKPALATKLKGKVVTVKAGQNVKKYTIGDAGGTEYIIDISVA